MVPNPASHADVTLTLPSRRPRRVLLVEDDPDCAETLELALGRAGYVVVHASTYATAQQDLASLGVDVVLTDVSYPDHGSQDYGPHGLELAEDASACGIPCVLMSGEPIDGEAHPGALRFPRLSKPFRLHELYDALDQVGAGVEVTL